MVDRATALTSRQIDTWLRVIETALRRLPEAERHWADPHTPEDDRVRDHLAFHAEWDEQVTRFEELATAYEAGQLSPEQQTQFRALMALLTSALPELQRLKLRTPSPDRVQRLVMPLPPRSA